MVVAELEGGFGVGAELGEYAPLVVEFWGSDPDGERHAEIVGEGEGVGLVEGADGGEAAGGGGVAAELKLVVAQGFAEMVEVFGGEAIDFGLAGPGLALLNLEDAADIDEGVAGHDEGELGLAGGFAFDDGDKQGTGVEDRDEGGEPALGIVLGAVIAEDGVGDVGFEDLCGPTLPFGE